MFLFPTSCKSSLDILETLDKDLLLPLTGEWCTDLVGWVDDCTWTRDCCTLGFWTVVGWFDLFFLEGMATTGGDGLLFLKGFSMKEDDPQFLVIEDSPPFSSWT